VDVVTANSASNSISFLRGHGDVTLGPRTNYAVGKAPLSVAVADFDGNGRVDVAVANSGDGTVTTLLQSTAALSNFSLSFGKQVVGTTSAAKTVTLFNAGVTTLHISGISISGDFSVQSSTCGATLLSGTSCKLGIAFQPTAVGTRKGALLFGDDALGSPQMVSLSGKGI
jgi:HYDIN/CFA65/VesB family protein/VCBS repeat protein